MSERERPSRHGALLGEALAAMAEAGRVASTVPIGAPCLTCAFRPGCMTNQMAATGVVALNCTIGIDPDEFACHHGMQDGQPIRLCNGYLAAKLAPFDFMKSTLREMYERLSVQIGPDEIRAAFDAWRQAADPDGKMDDYQLARAYAGAAA